MPTHFFGQSQAWVAVTDGHECMRMQCAYPRAHPRACPRAHNLPQTAFYHECTMSGFAVIVALHLELNFTAVVTKGDYGVQTETQPCRLANRIYLLPCVIFVAFRADLVLPGPSHHVTGGITFGLTLLRFERGSSTHDAMLPPMAPRKLVSAHSG